MKPKVGDKIFIERCDLIGRKKFVAEIQDVYLGEQKLVKIMDVLWFDITYFNYDKNRCLWVDIQPNNIEKSLVKYGKNK